MLPLKYYIEAWIFPPGINILLVFIGIATLRILPRLSKCFMLIGIVSLWALSTPYFASHLIDNLQLQYPLLNASKENVGKAAIVVLGGGDLSEIEYNNKRTISDATLHRLNYGATLAKKFHYPIIVSGGKVKGLEDSEADLMGEYLARYHKINSVMKEEISDTTLDEGEYVLHIAKRKNIDTLYLVTNAWHMPRSMYAFRNKDISVIPAPMGYFNYDKHYSLMSFLPNKEALNVSATAFHEYIGLLWYYLRNNNSAMSGKGNKA